MNVSVSETPLTEAERLQVLERLSPLLHRQVEKYLALSGTSIASETAQELLRSLLYTLRLALVKAGMPERELLRCDLAALLRQGQTALQAELEETKALWKECCLTAPGFTSVYYRDSLTELSRFFQRWDLWYFAHRLPCAIDYPLCLPVPDEEQGVVYARRWLERLLTENRLLGCFPAAAVEGLLRLSNADFRNCPENLCEQPLANAVGLALLEKPARPLVISPEDCRRLLEILRTCRGLGGALDSAAVSLAGELAPLPAQAGAYLRKTAAELYPRIAAALPSGSLSGIFRPQP